MSADGSKAKFMVRKEPCGLILRYLRTGYVLRTYRSRALSPFGLSLSKPSAWGTKAPFNRLRANGKKNPVRAELVEACFQALWVARSAMEQLT
jgi:hypothetical protein